jgi:RNase H-fold protein (predicted Holliday junction resolvase)
MQQGPLAALDPGRSKCGLVCSDAARMQVVEAAILEPETCRLTLARWQQQPGGLAGVVLGNGTGSQQWQQQLKAMGLAVLPVDEWGTTLAARQRYWQLWPPQGWRRLLPRGLRLPPRDLDDLAAQILLERWLQQDLPRGPQALGPRSGPAR